MAKERIYIRGYSETNPCDVCNDLSGEECDYCEKNSEWNASISRAEAIDKMLEAYVNIHLKLHDEEGRRPTDSEWAGAMLDALLEEK